MSILEVLSAVGGFSGVLGLLGAAVGYGRLQQRLLTVEHDVGKLGDLTSKVSRIDERTKNTDVNVRDLKESIGDLTRALLSGPQRHEANRRRAAGSSGD